MATFSSRLTRHRSSIAENNHKSRNHGALRRHRARAHRCNSCNEIHFRPPHFWFFVLTGSKFHSPQNPGGVNWNSISAENMAIRKKGFLRFSQKYHHLAHGRSSRNGAEKTAIFSRFFGVCGRLGDATENLSKRPSPFVWCIYVRSLEFEFRASHAWCVRKTTNGGS